MASHAVPLDRRTWLDRLLSLATKLNRKKLIAGTSIFFALNLVLFSIVGSSGVREGVVFYLWLGIHNKTILDSHGILDSVPHAREIGAWLFPAVNH